MKSKAVAKSRVFIFGGEDFYEAQKKARALIESFRDKDPHLEIIHIAEEGESQSEILSLLERLREEILTPSLFATTKLIFWKGASFLAANGLADKRIEEDIRQFFNLLQDPPLDELIVVILAESIDKRKKLFQELKAHFHVELTDKLDPLDPSSLLEVMEKLEQRGIEADQSLGQQLLMESRAQRSLLDMEIEKLSLFLGEKGKIQPEEISNLLCGKRETVIWRLCDLVISAKFDLALVELQILMQEGGSEMGILLALAQRIFWACLGLVLLKIGWLDVQSKGKYLKLILKEEGYFLYPQKKSGELVNQWAFGQNLQLAQNIDLDFWLWALRHTYETNKILISGNISPDLRGRILERLLIKLKIYYEKVIEKSKDSV
ncbi:DNA polymerase III subunit delta [Methylacidiphilum sp. Yel]|jgi:DNA polymerase-3 subunit delta|uniref:DNA polymerase III subunit delta n=1 Tax=Methylacidiphilum sp. Yel TaxID=1847730 RepID=UPI001068ED2C|nr:DNA polymerase III subunit delta [Methylacidiphilum sp. Yel]TFE67721.1 DNA polymerase III subunit delta [Methylacidiphilum sp. Yel]